MMVNNNLVGGIPTPLKNDGVKVSWDDDIRNIGKVIKFHGSKFQTTNQLMRKHSRKFSLEDPALSPGLDDEFPLKMVDCQGQLCGILLGCYLFQIAKQKLVCK